MNKRVMRKELIRLTWPLFIELSLFMLLGTVDTIMLSRYSDKAVAAVSVSNQIAGFINLLFAVVTTGTAILCAQYKGAQDEKNLGIVATISLLFNATLGIVLSLVLILFAKNLLSLLNVPQEVMPYGVDYLTIVGGAAFVQALLSTISAIVRSHGFTKITMYSAIGMNILNIIGNYLLIFGKFGLPALGVRGSALSTSVSRSLALIVMFIILVKKVDKNISFKLLRPFPFDMLKRILKIGIPSAGEQISYNTSQMVITSFITQMGTNTLAAKAYINNITMFTIVFTAAIGQGTSILVGNKIGAKKQEEAYHICLDSVKVGIGISVSVALMSAVFSRTLTSIFTSNEEIIKIASLVLIIDVLVEVGKVFNVVIISSLRAAGDVKFPVYCGILSMWGVSVLFSFIFGVKFGFALAGIWIACGMDEWLRGIIMLFRWKSSKWRKMGLI